jgi:hypothetical protein
MDGAIVGTGSGDAGGEIGDASSAANHDAADPSEDVSRTDSGASRDGGGEGALPDYCSWEICSATVVDFQWESLGGVEARMVAPCTASLMYIYTRGCAIPFSGRAVAGCISIDAYNPAGTRLYNPPPALGIDYFLVCLPPETSDGAAPLDGLSLFCKIDADCGEPVIDTGYGAGGLDGTMSNVCAGQDVLISRHCHPSHSDKELHGCRATQAFDNNGKPINLARTGGMLICR